MDQDEVIEADLVLNANSDTRSPRGRELLAVMAAVVLADVTIYRGHGYTGHAVLLLATPLLIRWGAPPLNNGRRRHVAGQLIVGCLILGLAAKMIWCGWGLHILLGAALLFAFSLSVTGTIPDMFAILLFPARLIPAAVLGMAVYCRAIPRQGPGSLRIRWLNIGLPLITFIAFSFLFILANPNLLDSFGRHAEELLTRFRQTLIEFSPHPTEMIFWVLAAVVMVGLLRPLRGPSLLEPLEVSTRKATADGASQSLSPFFVPARNTLATVILLFAIYLIFEFRTLWFREFPPGFYYSGYAHQGAAWLTCSLALATVILSLVFRGTVLHDPRVKGLRGLAWVWSLENILLAIAVYHRLYIYVGFNGMTRMRIVGILGITSVLVGFLLVVWKIAVNRGFPWLLRRHLWTVALAVYLYGALPVDSLVVAYNVRRILSGDPAPSVQITEQSINSAGVLLLTPLLYHENELIREGVRAYLADWYESAKAGHQQRQQEGWTSCQCADELLLSRLRALDDQLAAYQDNARRREAFNAFRTYAYQWY